VVRGLLARDLVAILDFLRGAAAVGGPRTFAAYMTSELPRVIPSALTAFAEFDLVKRSVRWVMDPPAPNQPNPAQVVAAHIDDDPFIVHRKRTGDAGAIRLSDLTPPRAFRDTGLYREFYRPLHLAYALACALRLGQREMATVALYRSGSDFSERDRLCLDLLRPHLAHLHWQSEGIARTRRDLALVTRGLEACGQAFVIVDREGRIRRAAHRAHHWLAQYFGPGFRPDFLPEPLLQWVRGTMDARAHVRLPTPQPLVVERKTRRLTVRLLSQPPDRLVLLDETATRVEPAVLARLGLSPREAEVLASVASGATNPAIAVQLHLSPRTVQTHLERVYRKLRVQTRTAAAARALETIRAGPRDQA
jgi:DNA-binding CsgD family transcriptional regulator